jgi:hypothetical protein
LSTIFVPLVAFTGAQQWFHLATLPALGMTLFILAAACQEENFVERDYPLIRTGSVDHITTEGARFNASIIEGTRESIKEYGFVWNTNANVLDLQYAERIVVSGSPESEIFSLDITFALDTMKLYYVRSYIRANKLTLYGNMVSFISLGSQAPIINDFEPKSGSSRDTITIYGRNFSYQGFTNKVLFGETPGRVTFGSYDELRVIIPDNLNHDALPVSVEVMGRKAVAEERFTPIPSGKFSSSPPTNRN